MSEYTYTAVFEPAEEGGYVVTFPAVPHLATQGETLEEARAMAQDCLQGYLEWRVEDGLPLPEGESGVPDTIREPVTVMLPAAMDGKLERVRAGEELLRIINRPKWREPGPEPSEDETTELVVDEVKRMRREHEGSR